MSQILMEYYQRMRQHTGPQDWWPADSAFEIVAGAILTQNTNWKNVEKAIHQLKQADRLSPQAILQTDINQLALLIRSSGYYNQKAKRLHGFVHFLFEHYQGSLDEMFGQETDALRQQLLSIKGIGPETADSILLYAGNHPIFVVDQYTWRIFHRHGHLPESMDYHSIQEWFMQALKPDAQLYNEYHALIVQIGKDFCSRTKPKCDTCPLQPLLPA